MNVYRDLDQVPASLIDPVVTLGNFDGVHRGHRRIFELLNDEARALGGGALVITFHPHPLKVLFPERAPLLITTLEERIELIRRCGVGHLLCIPFTTEFARRSADRFVDEVLVDRLAVRKVIVGEDFRFGRDRAGDLAFLRDRGEKHGFEVKTVQPIRLDGTEVSSTRIRQAIRAGEVRESARLLGRRYGIQGTVVTGDRRGKGLGFPTANLNTGAELLPPNGVYAVWAQVEGEWLPGVASLGIKPTFAGSTYTIEVHIFDFGGDIYGRPLRVDFVDRLREERSYPNVQALVEQIERDVQQARRVLEEDVAQASFPHSSPAKSQALR